MSGVPTLLDTLFRFHKHDDPGSTLRCEWNVSASSIDNQNRLYRIVYTEDTVTYEQEVKIPFHNYKKLLKDFYLILKKVIEDDTLSFEFRDVCKELLITDPWLNSFDL
jgi:hypothetical protein